jgi:hypothetical protein
MNRYSAMPSKLTEGEQFSRVAQQRTSLPAR